MRARYVNEMTEGARVDAVFVVRSRDMRAARTGDAYLALELSDRTGSIPAVHFRPSAAAAAVPSGAAVRVCGTVSTFRGSKRLSVDSLAPADAYDADELLARSPRSNDEMVAELKSIVGTVSDTQLRRVLRSVFGEPVFFERFCACPGSQSRHHVYRGGLLEHTLSVARLCVSAADAYSGVDRDLLVAAALLHDVGKVEELCVGPGIGCTDEGRLLGHVVLGLRRVGCAAAQARMRAHAQALLEHAIASHHGETEFGSPRRPSTIEALLLHNCDNMDAEAAGFVSALTGAYLLDEPWTDAGNPFRRPLYAPRAFTGHVSESLCAGSRQIRQTA